MVIRKREHKRDRGGSNQRKRGGEQKNLSKTRTTRTRVTGRIRETVTKNITSRMKHMIRTKDVYDWA
jgi:hypothetical protein